MNAVNEESNSYEQIISSLANEENHDSMPEDEYEFPFAHFSADLFDDNEPDVFLTEQEVDMVLLLNTLSVIIPEEFFTEEDQQQTASIDSKTATNLDYSGKLPALGVLALTCLPVASAGEAGEVAIDPTQALFPDLTDTKSGFSLGVLLNFMIVTMVYCSWYVCHRHKTEDSGKGVNFLQNCWKKLASFGVRVNMLRDYVWPTFDMYLSKFFVRFPVQTSIGRNLYGIGAVPMLTSVVFVMKDRCIRGRFESGQDKSKLLAGLGAMLGVAAWMIPFWIFPNLSEAGWRAIIPVGLCEAFIQVMCNELGNTIDTVRDLNVGRRKAIGIGIANFLVKWLVCSPAGAYWQASWWLQGMGDIDIDFSNFSEPENWQQFVVSQTSALILSQNVAIGNAMGGVLCEKIDEKTRAKYSEHGEGTALTDDPGQLDREDEPTPHRAT